ncbi:Twitching motility protein PilT [hydrothermal vent metagenome]|uniref:Twitching motility protein PilT n=1 Tax=hydrothermal vent metagenome TaxID=652676 RepID=A0A3B1DLR4_9ZZZZ
MVDEIIKNIECDPVCGMDVMTKEAEQSSLYRDYEEIRYFFCSSSCFQSFQMNPKRFVYGDEKKNKIIPNENILPLENTQDQLKFNGMFSWLKKAVESHACDLFLTVGEPPTIKVYGRFQQIDALPLSHEQMATIIQSILPDKKKEEFEKGGEIDLGLDIQGLSRFRINIFRQQNGASMAIRPLPYTIPSLKSLKLPDVFNDFISIKHGLILITGPTGSGKTTTLAAFINAINQQEERHIITIEDPIEYVIPNQRSLIHQREVGLHTQSFADGLRNALRENPDIIVVGELRDLESISLAIRAAETGHLVLGTLHSGTAVQTITRVLDVFDTARQPQIRIQLAQSLQAICSQRLIKKSDGQGMVLATEIMVATLALRNIIRQNRVQEIRGYMETGMRENMHTLKQSIQNLINDGLVSEEALNEVKEDILIK